MRNSSPGGQALAVPETEADQSADRLKIALTNSFIVWAAVCHPLAARP
jgi:hypothetical protein